MQQASDTCHRVVQATMQSYTSHRSILVMKLDMGLLAHPRVGLIVSSCGLKQVLL